MEVDADEGGCIAAVDHSFFVVFGFVVIFVFVSVSVFDDDDLLLLLLLLLLLFCMYLADWGIIIEVAPCR